jgi:hypothetical protein
MQSATRRELGNLLEFLKLSDKSPHSSSAQNCRQEDMQSSAESEQKSSNNAARPSLIIEHFLSGAESIDGNRSPASVTPAAASPDPLKAIRETTTVTTPDRGRGQPPPLNTPSIFKFKHRKTNFF